VLESMGFPRSQAMHALSVSKGDVERATNWLISNPIVEVEDPDLAFARSLQLEEEKKRERNPTVTCGLTGKLVPVDKLYILDECSCKFDKVALISYVAEAIKTQVDVKCRTCKASISVRDMKELMPTKESGMTPKVSSKQATQRIVAELKHILKTKPEQQGYSVATIKDNIYHWELKFFAFEEKEQIAQDLKALRQKEILLHITFPQTYPMNPPFCRVIRPRFAFRTGHVTIGGSICTELLTNKGWTPANTIEAVIVSIRAQFLEGGARLDLTNKRDYTEAEAKEAFNRMVQTHGWQ